MSRAARHLALALLCWTILDVTPGRGTEDLAALLLSHGHGVPYRRSGRADDD